MLYSVKNLVLNMGRPTRGVVIEGFDSRKGHYGIDIAESPDENVVAVWDGIVIMSDYTANDGYTLIIQHNEELVTVYRNCHSLLKGVGDKVVAGEAIATLSNTVTDDEPNNHKPFLHLELWHRGRPLDPVIYIPF